MSSSKPPGSRRRMRPSDPATALTFHNLRETKRSGWLYCLRTPLHIPPGQSRAFKISELQPQERAAATPLRSAATTLLPPLFRVRVFCPGREPTGLGLRERKSLARPGPGPRREGQEGGIRVLIEDNCPGARGSEAAKRRSGEAAKPQCLIPAPPRPPPSPVSTL